MAARVHAAAQHSLYWILVYSLLIVYVSLSITYAQTHIQEYVKYSRDELIIIGLIPGDCIFNQEVPTHEIPSLDFRGLCGLLSQPGSNEGGTERGNRSEAALCVYTNNSWCTSTVITDNCCSPDLEYLSVRCRPFYLP